MAYDIDKVARIIADLQNEGLAEAEIRMRLSQAGLPNDITDKALQKLAKTRAPEEETRAPADELVPAPSEIVSRKTAIPVAQAPTSGFVARTTERAPSIRESMEAQEEAPEEEQEKTAAESMRAMVRAPIRSSLAAPKPVLRTAQTTGGGSTDDRLVRIEMAVKDINSHVAALQQITEQVLDTNRNILLSLRKK